MDLHKAREITRQASYYHIKHKIVRDGTGFEYSIQFNEDLILSDGHKALKLIDREVDENKLSPYTKPYRVGFGWEIG
jgi:hypothetical protein